MSAVNNQVAALQAQAAQAQQRLASLTGGGGTAAGTAAAGTAATAAAAAPTADNNVPGVLGSFPSSTGAMVTVTRDSAGQLSISPTGRSEVVKVGGKTVRFDPTGKKTTAFKQMLGYQFQVNLDNREGTAAGLSNLSKMFAAGQERVKLLSNAIADDAAESGSFDPSDMQMLSMLSTTQSQQAEMEKKVYDSLRDAIQAWLR